MFSYYSSTIFKREDVLKLGDREEIIVPEGIEEIEERAFLECLKLKKIVLPKTLKLIGESTFSFCLYLKEIIIPEGIETIETETFSACHNLKKITLPNSLKIIGERVFSNCESLEEIVITEGVESIGEGCFCACENLQKVTLPNSLKKIETFTFSSCYSLEEITIPEGVETIGEYCFMECENLKKVTLPNSLKKIGERVFSNCNSLEEIVIPEGVEEIGKYAFEWCDKLKRITLPPSLKRINATTFISCRSLEEIIIPEGVEKIDCKAFCACHNLKKINLSNSLKKIGDCAFKRCSSLEEITIPEGVEEIEYWAFEECENLRKIKLPYSLTEAKNIFFKNDKLEEIEMYANKNQDMISLFYSNDPLSKLVNINLNIRFKNEIELMEFIQKNIQFFKIYKNVNNYKNKKINFIGPQVGNLEKKINRLLTTSFLDMFTIKKTSFRLINEYDYLKEQAEVELEKEKRNNNKYLNDQEVNNLITNIQKLTTFLPKEYKEQIDNKINEMVSEYYEKCEQFIPKYGELNTIELNFQNIETIKLDLISKLNLLNFNLYNIKKYNELLSNTKLYEKMINDSSLESIILNNYSKTYDISKPIDISKIESMEDIDECIKIIYIISDIYNEEEKNNIRQQLKQIIENEITNIYDKIQKELEGNPFNDEIVKEKDELTLKIIQMTKDLVETHNNKGMYIKLLKDIQTTEVEYKSSEEIKDIIKSLKYIITYVEKEEDKKFNDKLNTIIDKYKNIINNIIDNNRDEETDYDEIGTNLKNELLLLVIKINEEIYKYRYIEIPLKMKKDLLERKKSIINELLLLKQILIHNQAVDIEQRDILYISNLITIYKQVLSSSTRNISIKKYNFLICINQYLLLLEKDSNQSEYIKLELEIKKTLTHMETELKLLLYENNINSSKKVI